MLDWFVDLFTIEHLAYFVLGVMVACIYHLAKARVQHRTVIIKWQYVGIPLAAGIIFNIALQNQENADCVREFNQTLRVRSEISTQNDRLSIEQRELIYTWMHDLIFPPPEIAQLPSGHPGREQYALETTLEADKEFRESIEVQRENDRKRAENPLPAPTCGL